MQNPVGSGIMKIEGHGRPSSKESHKQAPPQKGAEFWFADTPVSCPWQHMG